MTNPSETSEHFRTRTPKTVWVSGFGSVRVDGGRAGRVLSGAAFSPTRCIRR